MPGSPRFLPSHGPAVLVVDRVAATGDHATCTGDGLEMNFAANLVTDHPQDLPFEIAWALGQYHRLATGEHWALTQQTFHKPLKRWERSKGKNATKAGFDQKGDMLEAAFMQKHEMAMTDLMARWGFAMAQASTSPAEPSGRGNTKG